MIGLVRKLFGDRVPRRLQSVIDLMRATQGSVDWPSCVEKPEGRRVLVLAPHPDDDILGCGGTLAKHHRVGDHIVSAYLTDGREGRDAHRSAKDVAAERKHEAEAAAEAIGIDRLVFLDRPDTRLAPDAGTIARLRALLEEIDPDVVYLPFVLDAHPDHRAANAIFVAAAASRPKLICYGYEVWTPVIPNCFVDVTEVLEAKRTALTRFASQSRRFNLVDVSLGLAKYRSVMLFHGDRFVECFYRCRAEHYAKLWDLVRR